MMVFITGENPKMYVDENNSKINHMFIANLKIQKHEKYN